MVNKEYVCMEETPEETQKLIRTWVSTGYLIEVMYQQALLKDNSVVVFTSVWRTKK